MRAREGLVIHLQLPLRFGNQHNPHRVGTRAQVSVISLSFEASWPTLEWPELQKLVPSADYYYIDRKNTTCN